MIQRLLDSLPPHSPEAEAALCGACIIEPAAVDDVLPIVGPAAFYAERHAAIFAAIVECHEKRCGGDLVALTDALRDKGILDDVGGVDYLVRLAEQTPSAVGAVTYARTVRDKHRLRRIIDAAGQAMYDALHAGDTDVDAVVSLCEERMFDACGDAIADRVEHMPDLIAAEAERLDAIHNGEIDERSAPSSWRALDTMLNGGAKAGEMIVVAARPSMGKTAFGVQWAASMSHAGIPVLFVSLEMTGRSLAQRLISLLGPMDLAAVVQGTLSEWGIGRVHELRTSAEAQSLYVYDRADSTIEQIKAVARRMRRRHNIGAVFIDYMQLLAVGQRNRNRYEEVTLISRAIKMMAKSVGVPVIVLAQLNRQNTQRAENRPRLADLRDSGAIEQDADVVVLLHREGYYHAGDMEWLGENDVTRTELIVAKNRNGATGIVETKWIAESTRFAEVGR